MRIFKSYISGRSSGRPKAVRGVLASHYSIQSCAMRPASHHKKLCKASTPRTQAVRGVLASHHYSIAFGNFLKPEGGYAKYFAVDMPCLIKELEMLGVKLSEVRKKQE